MRNGGPRFPGVALAAGALASFARVLAFFGRVFASFARVPAFSATFLASFPRVIALYAGVLAPLAAVLALGSAPGVASAQQITVRGTVVERAQESWVGGATVRLSGHPPWFTDLDGRFEFSSVAPGRHTLTVQAMGYETRYMDLVLTADTAFVVEMDPDPIVLDSLLVRLGTVTIRGRVLDAQNPNGIVWAEVSILPGFPAKSTTAGHFTIRKVPAGQAVTVLVESVGYMQARMALITDADTTLTVELEPDPIGLRMLALEVEKLESRSRGVPFPRRIMGRERLDLFYPGWPVAEIVKRELAMFGRNGTSLDMHGTHPCLFLDDRSQMHWAFLWGIDQGQVERIEIYDRGGMVRVYTKRFLIKSLGREPGPMVYMKGGLGLAVCR